MELISERGKGLGQAKLTDVGAVGRILERGPPPRIVAANQVGEDNGWTADVGCCAHVVRLAGEWLEAFRAHIEGRAAAVAR